ncbi:MAG TPA: hypothetical protein VFA68_15145 [Terriglobales bacterium]|nr:hypothetical protein [Terriglobales bacterium]
MTKVAIDLIGWMGALLLLGAYGCVSFRKLGAESLIYQLANALGSCCLILNTLYYRAFPSAFVNVVWIAIAIVAGFRIRTRSQESAALREQSR